MRKSPFAGIELTSQRVRGLRGTSELPGRPVVDITYVFGLSIEAGRERLSLLYISH